MVDDDGNLLPHINLNDIDLSTRSSANGEELIPLIRLENGDYIWGIECWFQGIYEGDNFSVDEAQEGVKLLIESLVPRCDTISADNDN